MKDYLYLLTITTTNILGNRTRTETSLNTKTINDHVYLEFIPTDW